MSAHALSYAVITPVWNEAANLERLADCLRAQSAAPETWVIVDTGSTDQTLEIAQRLADATPWIHVLTSEEEAQARGGPVVRAFNRGIESLGLSVPDVVVKLDADLDFESTYFSALLDGFGANPQLGMASGACFEFEDGAWVARHGTRSHVWGASRAYRRSCLADVLPLEERQGWDEIDAIKAQLHGWEVGTIYDVPFRHLRAEGRRDGGRKRWTDQGDTAHYMGYRFSYLLMRTAFKTRHDPAAVAMVWGYVRAVATRAPVLPDPAARAYLRRTQRLRELGTRAREARGLAADPS
jgi:glycosyltransferase involved in cell wall biosynthesis